MFINTDCVNKHDVYSHSEGVYVMFINTDCVNKHDVYSHSEGYLRLPDNDLHPLAFLA